MGSAVVGSAVVGSAVVGTGGRGCIRPSAADSDSKIAFIAASAMSRDAKHTTTGAVPSAAKVAALRVPLSAPAPTPGLVPAPTPTPAPAPTPTLVPAAAAALSSAAPVATRACKSSS